MDEEEKTKSSIPLQKQPFLFDTEIEKTSSDNEWLLTYTDMLTLLITLFVVMLSHSTFEEIKPAGDNETIAVNQEKGIPPNINIFDKLGSIYGEKAGAISDAADRIEGNLNELQKIIEDENLLDDIEVIKEAGAIKIEIGESVLFETGDSELYTQGKSVLGKITPVFKNSQLKIIVEGHTDNIPIKSVKYPSNWELSADRALSVIHYLEEEGIEPRRLQAIAFGETHPIAPNSTLKGRKKNRRVQIILK